MEKISVRGADNPRADEKKLSSAAKFSVDKIIIQVIAIIGRSIRRIVVPESKLVRKIGRFEKASQSSVNLS